MDPWEMEQIDEEELDQAEEELQDEPDDQDEGGSRRDRRNQRAADWQSKVSEIEKQNAELRGRLDQMSRALQQAPQPPPQPQDVLRQVDEVFSPRIQSAREARDAAGQALVSLQSQKASESEIAAARKRFDEAEEAMHGEIAQRQHYRMLAQQPQPDPSVQRRESLQQRRMAQFPEVMNNPKAAASFYAHLLEAGGGDPNYQMTAQDEQQAAEAAMAKHKLGKYKDLPPDQMQLRGTSGMPSGHLGGGRQSSASRPLTGWDKRMMDELYRDVDDPKKREQMYRREVLAPAAKAAG